MTRVGAWLAMLFLAALIAAPGSARADLPPAPAQRNIQEAVRDANRSLGAQTTMPGEKKDRIIVEENRQKPSEPSNAITVPADFALILLFCALGVALIIILMTLRDNLWSASRSRRISGSGDETVVTDAAVTRMDQAQVAAEELAYRGSFAEAMHVMLLQSVGEMRRSLDIAIAASLTSREILARISLPPVGQQALADIINRVEISYFGPHQPGADDYEACRASFMALTDALRLRVAA